MLHFGERDDPDGQADSDTNGSVEPRRMEGVHHRFDAQ